MTTYPPSIAKRFKAPTHAGRADGAAADGLSASFVCGAFVDISLRVDEAGRIVDARFRTNGCGFMVAGADILSERLRDKLLTDLHGLDGDELYDILRRELGEYPDGRRHCAEVVFEALRKALAVYRQKLLEEFQGEKALICTCFSVTEDEIAEKISALGLTDIEDVVGATRAGSGCGSCRMMIQEMLDGAV